MSELRKEYQAIVDVIISNWKFNSIGAEAAAIREAATLIQKLADSKEPVLLTDAEMKIEADKCGYRFIGNIPDFARAIEAACHAKQKQVTREVTVRIYQNALGQLFSYLNTEYADTEGTKLLDEFTRTVELK